MKNKFFPILILLAALLVSGSAAFYSVTGLSKLFSGAATAVIIMASTLEFSKLVIATILHRYWKKLHWLLKSYLISAVIILVVITSAGIYGFLSNAYQITNTKDSIVQTEIAILKSKQTRFNERKTFLIDEKNTINNSLSGLRNNLNSSNQSQQIDRKTGQVITNVYTNIKSQNVIQNQISEITKNRDLIDLQIKEVSDSISSLDLQMLEREASSDVAAELGPLKYLTRLTGKSMDSIVNWFLILLIIVFDPLAIVLVITANFAFGHINELEDFDVQPIFRPAASLTSNLDTHNNENTPNSTEPLKTSPDENIDEMIKSKMSWAYTGKNSAVPNDRNTPHQDKTT